MLEYDKGLIKNAKVLRKTLTKQEKHLWYDYLSTYPVRFQRQKTIGKFIVDFYCAKARLVIELDGSQHYKPQNKVADNIRTEKLKEYNLMVMRISNLDVNKNFAGVCTTIDSIVKQRINQAPSDEGAVTK